MQAFLYFLYAVQILSALGLTAIVVTSTSKDSSLGAIGGGDGQSSSRYKGGMEEMIDRWGAQLSGVFLLVSLLAAIIERQM